MLPLLLTRTVKNGLILLLAGATSWVVVQITSPGPKEPLRVGGKVSPEAGLAIVENASWCQRLFAEMLGMVNLRNECSILVSVFIY
jgi:hypothetical protein